MPVENVLFEVSHDLHVGGVPAVEVLPDARVERFKVEMLDQIRLKALSLALGHELV